MRFSKRFSLTVVALAAAIACVPASASAATSVSVVSGQLRVVAASGVANNISVFPYGSYIKVTDPADAATPGAGCTTTSGGVKCSGATSLLVQSGDGNDQIITYSTNLNQVVESGSGDDYVNTGDFTAKYDQVYLGDGNDVLDPGSGDDVIWCGNGDDTVEKNYSDESGDAKTIYGETGADTITGSFGDDVISGGANDDTVDGGFGADTIDGGSGWDTVTYESRTNGVTVTANDVANDGETGEGDNVSSSMEGIAGGSGDDDLTSVNAAVLPHLWGNAGDDVLTGADVVTSSGDVIYGGSGSDTVNSRSGRDTIYIDDNDDDSVNCGDGTDYVFADLLPFDATVTACESVSRS